MSGKECEKSKREGRKGKGKETRGGSKGERQKKC